MLMELTFRVFSGNFLPPFFLPSQNKPNWRWKRKFWIRCELMSLWERKVGHSKQLGILPLRLFSNCFLFIMSIRNILLSRQSFLFTLIVHAHDTQYDFSLCFHFSKHLAEDFLHIVLNLNSIQARIANKNHRDIWK